MRAQTRSLDEARESDGGEGGRRAEWPVGCGRVLAAVEILGILITLTHHTRTFLQESAS
jgi:hypothetical protein